MHARHRNICIRAVFLFLISFLILNVSPVRGEADENLLYNGDFEILDAEGLPDGWFTDAYLMDPGYSLYSVSEGMDGNSSHSATVRNIAGNDARFAQTVQVEPDTLYCLSGYIRAEEITEGLGANLSIEGVYAFSESKYNTDGEWQYVEYYGITGPDQYYLTVFARVGGYSGESKGSGSFDRLSLRKTDSVPDDSIADRWYADTGTGDADKEDESVNTDSTNRNFAGSAWVRLLLIGMIYCFCAAAAIYYFRDGKREPLNRSIPDTGACAFFLTCAFVLRLAVSYFSPGYEVDVNCFTSWGARMANQGPARFYNPSAFCDYPPLYLYVLGANSWLTGLTGAGTGLSRVIFRLVPSAFDVAACWMLLRYPRNKYTSSSSYKVLIILLAFNPLTVLNSASWGQMDSVLCFLLLCVGICAIEGRWIPAIAFYATAVLIKPQALMLGFLGLAYMVITAVQNKKMLKKILIATGIGLLLIIIYVLPFGIHQEFGWLIKRYTETLSSYPYATVNTANIYYLAGGNWSRIQNTAHFSVPLFFAGASLVLSLYRFMKRKNGRLILSEAVISVLFSVFFTYCIFARASWSLVGTGAMVYAYIVVLFMAVQKKNISFLPYLGSLLFILLYVFGLKMHERYLFPAIFLLMLAWALHRDRRILYILLLFSFTVFINEGIVLDNSIRLGASLGHLNSDTVWLADILSALNILAALYAVYLGFRITEGNEPAPMKKLPGFLPFRKETGRRRPEDYKPDRALHWTKRDTIILLCITAAYSFISLTTLGSTKAPQNEWTSSGEDEQIIFDLGEIKEDVRVLYFAQVSRYDFTVASSEDAMTWSPETWAQMDQGQCWKWKYVTQSYGNDSSRTYYNSTGYESHFRGRYLRITAHQVGLTLNEVIFRDSQGQTIPAVVYGRNGDNPDSVLWSNPENLLDEQDSMENLPGLFGTKQEGETQPSWWNSTYFDEIYHARTGFEFLKGTVPYETSHPPLGKIFISWCIAIFGMTPFGWRFAGALAGILMLPGIYLLAKQLTKKTGIAFIACALLALDCMHLTQTQIATIDSFPVLFIIFAYFFMLRFIQTDLTRCSLKKALFPLALCGFFMGLSIASKWIGIYAGIGLAVLFFWHCLRNISISKTADGRADRETLEKIFYICLWCLLFFIVVPVGLYLLSYIPYMAYNTRIAGFKDFADAVWKAQVGMLSYHSTPGLGMDHPFYSPWWQWPIIGKPMFYATEQYIPADASLHHSIFCFGNPVIWWGALGGLAFILFRFVRTKHYQIEGEEQKWHLSGLSFDNRYEFLLIGLMAQYLPWVLVPRGTYIYHYFASIPFLILALSLCFDCENGKYRRLLIVSAAVFLSLSFAAFMALLPYTTGLAAPVWWLNIGKSILRIWY